MKRGLTRMIGVLFAATLVACAPGAQITNDPDDPASVGDLTNDTSESCEHLGPAEAPGIGEMDHVFVPEDLEVGVHPWGQSGARVRLRQGGHWYEGCPIRLKLSMDDRAISPLVYWWVQHDTSADFTLPAGYWNVRAQYKGQDLPTTQKIYVMATNPTFFQLGFELPE